MTRKDFEFIAATLRVALDDAKQISTDQFGDGRADGVRLAAETFADRLQIVNPSFNRARFLAACGVEG